MIWSADCSAYGEKAHAVEWLYKEDSNPIVVFTKSTLLN